MGMKPLKNQRLLRPFSHYTRTIKAQLVRAFREGELTFDQISTIHNVSSLEFAAWENYYDKGGLNALKATRCQESNALYAGN